MGRPVPEAPDKTKVGILAGTFNPPHNGHLHISARARELLGLDEVRWLVTPNHPLKPELDYSRRLAMVKNFIAPHGWLRLDDTEERINGINYTYMSLEALKADKPNFSMVFLIGYDAFAGVCGWRRWRRALAAMPWAVFPRKSGKPLPKALSRYRADWRRLFAAAPPIWALLPAAAHPASSSAER